MGNLSGNHVIVLNNTFLTYKNFLYYIVFEKLELSFVFQINFTNLKKLIS